MNTTGRKLLKQLSLELEEQELSIKERKHYDALKKRVKYMAIAIAALGMIDVTLVGYSSSQPTLEKVKDGQIQIGYCENGLIGTIGETPYCVLA